MREVIRQGEIPIPGTEFVGRHITPAQFSILAVLYRYSTDGVQGVELVTVVNKLYQQVPVPGLVFDSDDIATTCTWLVANGLAVRKRDHIAITKGGINFYNTFVLVAQFIAETLPRQEIIEGQQECCAVIKVS